MIEVWNFFQILLRDTNLCTIFMRFRNPRIYVHVYVHIDSQVFPHIQIMACLLFAIKPLSEPIMTSF